MNFLVNVWLFLVVYVARSDSGLPMQRALPQNEEVESNPGLYNANDKVIVLTAPILKSEILGRNHGTLVEFYNSFCGHCKRFAPKYKHLAENLYPWRDIFKVAAFDCSTDENHDMCREYEVMVYPSLRYFGPHSVDGESNLGLTVDTQDLDLIASTAAKLIMEHSPPEESWPKFTNLVDSSPLNLFKGEPQTVQFAVVIFEPENSTLGAQTILNFSRIKELKVARTTNTQTAKDMGLVTFNVIKIFKRGSDSVSISLPNVSPIAFKIAIEAFMAEKGIKFHNNDRSSNSEEPVVRENDHDIVNEVRKHPYIVHQADLEFAVRYTIFHEIPAFSEIKGERLLALQRYLSVLSRYNALGDNGRRFIEDLKIYAFMHNQELGGKQFQEKAAELERLYTPIFSSSKWVGCKPSKTGLRGFTCTLWTLFHSLTVQAAEDENAFDPLEVLQAMHGYVKFFFGCTDCSTHFQDMASRRKIWNTSSKDEAVLWLWSAHNEVNERLAGDETEDPLFPKVQFPNRNACSNCIREHSSSPPADISNINWDKIEILQFMKRIHSPQNISRFGVDDETVLPASLEKMRSKRMIASVFSDIDMRMGILLYVFCIGMMFLAVKLFLRKGYRKKPYSHGFLGKV